MLTERRQTRTENTAEILEMILTEEFAVDFGPFLLWEKASVPWLWKITDVFQLKIN
jgi:hypothetical protein